ncbi:MAG: sulfite exporter TauE/SafE family protein, partial [Myxococcales bacterium]|nr:sulfite exporter TauE/SafE family protein [Myxococcales bacterium]
MFALAVLGLVAGVLTTLAGMGGGLFLLVALGLVYGPHVALAVTTPALLVSNLHRAWLFRADVDWRMARLVALGVMPGAIVGALLLPALPDVVVAALFTASTGFALLRATGRVRIDPKPRWITAYALAIGALAATSGGAGMLIAP